jgi:hypothetical protein
MAKRAKNYPSGKSDARPANQQTKVQPFNKKYFASRFGRHRFIDSSRPASLRGAARDRQETRGGMRWTRVAQATNAPIPRTAKSCGPDAPTLASSLRVMIRRRRWQESPVTGESAKEPVKTIAQGRPDRSGEPVVTYSYAQHFCIRGCGCIRHPAFPAPSVFGGAKFMHHSGATCAAGWNRRDLPVATRGQSG